MINSNQYANLRAKLTSSLASIRHNGLKGMVELLAFTLFFALGLVTLGACLLAGMIGALLTKWYAHNANQTDAKQDQPVSDSATQESQQPIVAA